MYVYSFSEKVFHVHFFYTLRLLIFEVSRLFFNISLKKNKNHPIMFLKHFQNRLNSLHLKKNCSLKYDYFIVHEFFEEFFALCDYSERTIQFSTLWIISLFVFINFWRISCPVWLFHILHLLGTQEYTCIVLWPANVLLHKVQWVPKSMTRNGYYWQVPASQKKLLLW